MLDDPRPKIQASELCVVVPAFNEATVIAGVIAALRQAFASVVVIDDGSHDDTAIRARQAGAVVVQHPINLGQGAALRTGFDYVLSRTDATHVVTFDADGQHDVADALRMVDLAKSTGVEVVLGTRLAQLGLAPRSRRLVLRGAVLHSRLTTGLPVTDSHNGLRVLSRHAIKTIDLRLNGMAHASEILSEVAVHDLTWTEAPVTIAYDSYSRAKGQSNLNAINVLFDLATAKLRSH